MRRPAALLSLVLLALAPAPASAQGPDGGVPDGGAGPDAAAEAAPRPPQPSPEPSFDRVLEYDRGAPEGDRHFHDAAGCRVHPCVVTQHGALRFNIAGAGDFDVRVYLLHEGRVAPVRIFERREHSDYRVFERIFDPHRNKRVWDLSDRLSQKRIDLFYILGLVQQYRITHGDVISVEMRLVSRPEWTRIYYFRYYDRGISWRPDVAFTVPFNLDTLYAREGRYRNLSSAAPTNLVGTLSLVRNADPGRPRGALRKIFDSVHPVAFAGPININFEKQNRQINDSGVTRTFYTQHSGAIDLFVGGGISLLDFFVVGYGVNVFRDPHVGFPLVGISVVHLSRVLSQANRSASEDWDEFIEEEKKRRVYPPPPVR